MSMIVFPDTNYFLHFMDPRDSPWAELTGHDRVRLDRVRLIVTRTIQGKRGPEALRLVG